MIKSALTCMDISLVKLNSLKHSTENKHSFAKPPIMTKTDFQANVFKTNSANQPSLDTSLEMDAKRTENQPEQLTFVTHKKKRHKYRNRNRKRNSIGVRDLTVEADDMPSIDSLASMVSNLSLCNERSYTGMSRVSFSRLPFVRPRKKLIVLDINGLLADIVSPPPKEHKADTKISRRAVFRRPECRDFLNFCFERFEVGVWSSRSEKIASKVLDYLMGDMKHKLLFCWDLSRCTATGYRTLENRHKTLVFKELRRIWEKHDDDLPWHRGEYNESNTLLLDDSPYKALLNPEHTAVFPHPYKFGDIGSDSSLGTDGDLRVYLEELSAAKDVQKFVEQNPFGQRPISENSPSWDFYLKVISTMYSLPNSISSECLASEKYKKLIF